MNTKWEEDYCNKFGLCKQQSKYNKCQCGKEIKFIKDQIDKALANQREQIKQALMDNYQQHTECDSFINEALNIKELQD